MRTSVIISTYNSPDWLAKVLWGYQCQTHKDFEIVISDDGSNDETRSLIEKFQRETELQLKHCWHEDDGFRKTEILNKSIQMASGEYLIFTDGDCIPRADFVETHLNHAEKGYFLSGGYCKLSMELSHFISKEHVFEQKAFDVHWMKKNGLKGISQQLKLGLQDNFAKIADKLTTTKMTWNGMNSSTFKSDIVRANGFNNNMRYGGLDRELGERLENARLQGKQIRHKAICLHLDHKRSYRNEADLKANYAIRKEVKEKGIVCCANGIQQFEEASTKSLKVEAEDPVPSLHTYLINLDRSEDRLAYSQKEFEQYGMNFQRFSAVDGKGMCEKLKEKLTAQKGHYYLPVTANEVGCFLSHINVLKEFLKSEKTHALVLEDDFKWEEDPNSILEELIQHNDYDILKLYSMKERKVFKVIKSLDIKSKEGVGYSIRQFPSVPICTIAQIYTRSGAQRIVDSFTSVKRPIDVEMKHYWEYNLKIYSLHPKIVTTTEYSKESTIKAFEEKNNLKAKYDKKVYNLKFSLGKWWNYYFK